MTRYALDTSVLLRWFSQSTDVDTEKALQLRQEHLAETVELIILDQALYELIHSLRESGYFDQDLISMALASLEFMHLTILPYSHEVAKKTTQIACEHDISTYAAGSVALGALLRCQAVTCDDIIYRKIASLPWTTLLSNLTL